MTFVNNGKGFPCLGGMACSYPSHGHLQVLTGRCKPKRIGFLETFKNPIDMKSQIKTKRAVVQVCGIAHANIKQNY